MGPIELDDVGLDLVVVAAGDAPAQAGLSQDFVDDDLPVPDELRSSEEQKMRCLPCSECVAPQ